MTDQPRTAHISDLKVDPRNARKRTERSAGIIAKSLEKFGAARSIVIDEDGQILAGHGTIEAAAQVGIENMVVVPADGNTIIAVQRSNLTPEQKTQYAIADNRASDLSTWDSDILKEIGDEHDLADWFTPDEFKFIVDDEWESDIEGVDKHGENTDGIEGKILIRCPSIDRADLKEHLERAIEESGIEGVTID